MPLRDGSGPVGGGRGRGLGSCMRGRGSGRKLGGLGLGATLLTYIAQDVVRENSLVRAGFRKAVGWLFPSRRGLSGPGVPDRSSIVEAEYKVIEDKEEASNAER